MFSQTLYKYALHVKQTEAWARQQINLDEMPDLDLLQVLDFLKR